MSIFTQIIQQDEQRRDHGFRSEIDLIASDYSVISRHESDHPGNRHNPIKAIVEDINQSLENNFSLDTYNRVSLVCNKSSTYNRNNNLLCITGGKSFNKKAWDNCPQALRLLDVRKCETLREVMALINQTMIDHEQAEYLEARAAELESKRLQEVARREEESKALEEAKLWNKARAIADIKSEEINKSIKDLETSLNSALMPTLGSGVGIGVDLEANVIYKVNEARQITVSSSYINELEVIHDLEIGCDGIIIYWSLPRLRIPQLGEFEFKKALEDKLLLINESTKNIVDILNNQVNT